MCSGAAGAVKRRVRWPTGNATLAGVIYHQQHPPVHQRVPQLRARPTGSVAAGRSPRSRRTAFVTFSARPRPVASTPTVTDTTPSGNCSRIPSRWANSRASVVLPNPGGSGARRVGPCGRVKPGGCGRCCLHESRREARLAERIAQSRHRLLRQQVVDYHT